MAPFVPEEVDVFTVPHSRMKELVNEYVEKVKTTNFMDSVDMEVLLQSLQKTFIEFKCHEQIENKYIMKRLKHKLKKLSIKNSAVCNCHKDSHLIDMMKLVHVGYSKKTVQDRINYGLQLKESLEDFTNDFLPHMKQEEEVFQPLLLKYFSYEELCELKKKVIQQHIQEKETDTEKVLEKWTSDAARKEHESSSSSSCESEDEELSGQLRRLGLKNDNVNRISSLPPEVILNIFSYMNPQDLGRCAQVCEDWSRLTLDPMLWREIHPVKWSMGEWGYRQSQQDNDIDDDADDEANPGDDDYAVMDEDADVDESEETQHMHQVFVEARILAGLVKYVLPKVGSGVEIINLANSRASTNGAIHRMLRFCPNVEYLNVSQTKVSDSAFKSLGKNHNGSALKTVILSGCVNVSDATLVRVALAQTARMINSPQRCESPRTASNECLCATYCDAQNKLARMKQKNLPRVCNDCNGSGTCTDCGQEPKREFMQAEEAGSTEISCGAKRDKNGVIECDNGPCRTLNADQAGKVCKKDQGACHLSCDDSKQGAGANLMIEDCHVSRDIAKTARMMTCSDINCKRMSAMPLRGGGCTGRRSPPLCDVDRALVHLNLSGCYKVTDHGIRALAGFGPYVSLTVLDLSGCVYVSGCAISALVAVTPNLNPENLFYCDNIEDGPYADVASGCRNLQCGSRYCCRTGE